MPDKFTKEVRSKIMSKIRSNHTTPEKILKEALKGTYLRYHQKGILGNPDFSNKKKKIAIFVDGDFWHGYNWKKLGKVPPKGFWQEKIERNIRRDKRYRRKLRREGWKVIRFWEHEVLKNVGKCKDKISCKI